MILSTSIGAQANETPQHVDERIVETIIDYTTQLLRGDDQLLSITRESARKNFPLALKKFEYQEANMYQNTQFPGGSEIINKTFQPDDLLKYLLLMTIDGKEHINILDYFKNEDNTVDQITIFSVLAHFGVRELIFYDFSCSGFGLVVCLCSLFFVFLS